jgi:hypothetical protein
METIKIGRYVAFTIYTLLHFLRIGAITALNAGIIIVLASSTAGIRADSID